MLRAANHAGILQFATATANLASQNAFLFLAGFINLDLFSS
jgi:hypothetical protein